MRLSTFTDYSLRVLMYLALRPTQRATVPEIAAAYGISEHHLTKVVHRLGQGGTIETVRGKSGGLRLARDPAAIRIGTVIRASEGDSAPVECMEETRTACCIAPGCRLAGILEEAFDALYASLDRYTLADLVTRPRVLQRLLQFD